MSEVKLSVCNIVQLFVLLHLFPNCPIYRNSECTTNIYWHLHITTVNHRHFAYIYIYYCLEFILYIIHLKWPAYLLNYVISLVLIHKNCSE